MASINYVGDGVKLVVNLSVGKLGSLSSMNEEHIDIDIREGPAPAPRGRSAEASQCLPNTVTIPCHHIRIVDFLMLQVRPTPPMCRRDKK